jgi:hypothetical protein
MNRGHLEVFPSQFSNAINTLNHPHPDYPFSIIGNETITALKTLAAILKNKFKKPLSTVIIYSPTKAAENKRPVVLIQPVVTSPEKHNYQTISQTEVNQDLAHVSEFQNSPQLLRVVTPAARSASPPRVPVRVRNRSPRTCPKGIYWIWEVPIIQWLLPISMYK